MAQTSQHGGVRPAAGFPVGVFQTAQTTQPGGAWASAASPAAGSLRAHGFQREAGRNPAGAQTFQQEAGRNPAGVTVEVAQGAQTSQQGGTQAAAGFPAGGFQMAQTSPQGSLEAATAAAQQSKHCRLVGRCALASLFTVICKTPI
jgi:hypothetical protein